MALKVVVMISLSLPHVEPDNASKTLFLAWSLDFRLAACCLKERRVSKQMPKNVGFLTVGTICPSTLTSKTTLASFENVENTVAEDLDGLIKRFLLLNQSLTVAR